MGDSQLDSYLQMSYHIKKLLDQCIQSIELQTKWILD